MRTLSVGLVVGRNETWSFIKDLYDDWQQHFDVDVFTERSNSSPFFRERLNRRQLQSDLSAFLKAHDVVFFEWGSELLALTSRLPKSARIITRIHRYEMYEWVERVNWDAVDTIILVSEAKRMEFVGRFPAQASKCRVVPVGVNLSKFPYHPKPFTGMLGILCHLSPRKRVYELILAFAELAPQQEGLHLSIGGGYQDRYADYYYAMIDMVRRLGLENQVTFDGPISDTPTWYRKIDIFISNSYSEGLQVAPMEAMASGCYTLSHWWAGADELLPVENLFCTETEMRQQILHYMALPESQKRQQVERLRRRAEERFDVQQTTAPIRALI